MAHGAGSASAQPIEGAVITQDTEFFNKPSYLTVSSQWHLEVPSRMRWPESGPCPHVFAPNARKLRERTLLSFWMLEVPEWSFVRSPCR